MPANEQTWRNPKLMHLVFAISSIAMLLATVWMMADDHNRPWKEYQRTFRELDVAQHGVARKEQETADYQQRLAELTAAVKKAQRTFTADDQRSVIDFLTVAEQQDKAFLKLAAELHRPANPAWDENRAKNIRTLATALVAEKDADAVAKGRSALLDHLNDILKPFRFREDNLTRELKDKKAIFAEAQSKFDQAVARDAAPSQLAACRKAPTTPRRM